MPSLTITEQDPFRCKLLPEDTILDLQILYRLLLFAIQPAGQRENEQMPGLHQDVHGNGSKAGEGSHSGTLTVLCSVALANRNRCRSRLPAMPLATIVAASFVAKSSENRHVRCLTDALFRSLCSSAEFFLRYALDLNVVDNVPPRALADLFDDRDAR